MAHQEDRFIKTYSQGGAFKTAIQIWVDKQTGVNYIYAPTSYGAAMTPLLNRDGSPVVTPIPKQYEE